MVQLPDELMFLKNSKAKQAISAEPMTGKVCVITGATSGVGLAALRRLADGGATVIAVCRNREKALSVIREITNKRPVDIDLIVADFSCLQQVRQAADQILARYPHIDVLINNAGMHSTKRILTSKGFELVFCVNHLASFLLTQLLLARLKESAPSRIIQVNSEGHRFNGLDPVDLDWRKRHYTGLKGYGASKTAQLLTVWELADRLRGSGVTINAMHPGDVKTNIGGNNGGLYPKFSQHFTPRFLKDPEISGEAIYYLAADPAMQGISGKFFYLTIEEKPAKHALDRDLGKTIWDLSCGMTGLDYR
jgi:NAD(P)-dependent dehydrogenase (short-subunit alcohol dehydrogenase family)